MTATTPCANARSGGKVLLEIGIPGRPSPFMSGEPFNRCTHTALSPDLDIYVSDGYANARVHKFAPNGKLLFSWGECGADPGQFNIPHNIVTDPDGWVYVADRENHRVQIFDGNGTLRDAVEQSAPALRPLYGRRRARLLLYRRIGAAPAGQPQLPESRAASQHPVARRQAVEPGRTRNPGLPPTQFSAPHGLAVDRSGDVYIGEVSWTAWQNYTNPGQPVPPTLRSLQKLVRVPQ